MIGDRLKKLRNEQGFTQVELAKKLNMSRSTYAQYEANRRKPDYDTVELFANYFKVSSSWIIYGSKLPIPDDSKYDDLREVTLEEEYARKGLTSVIRCSYTTKKGVA
ncbi:MAG: HTH-type transcriptional regulator Xre [Pelotomaculum sp. PtaU1.Bin065]|nr:MAG: HTH-type transcriptional regulator Xre [Pelotomaculum sp. PtaU1.Bin065]